jgi:hypothetical protein
VVPYSKFARSPVAARWPDWLPTQLPARSWRRSRPLLVLFDKAAVESAGITARKQRILAAAKFRDSIVKSVPSNAHCRPILAGNILGCVFFKAYQMLRAKTRFFNILPIPHH